MKYLFIIILFLFSNSISSQSKFKNIGIQAEFCKTSFIHKAYNTEKDPMQFGFGLGLCKEIKKKKHSICIALNYLQANTYINVNSYNVEETNFEPLSISNYRLNYIQSSFTYLKPIRTRVPFYFSVGLYGAFLVQSKISILFDAYKKPYNYVNTSVLNRFDAGSVFSIGKDIKLKSDKKISVFLKNQLGFVNVNNRQHVKNERISNLNFGIGMQYFFR